MAERHRAAPSRRSSWSPRSRSRRTCSPSCSRCRSRASKSCAAELVDGVRRRGPRLRAGAGGRRLPLPEPPRPRALRRAVRARRAVARLSSAALETLAIVAYKQPISRAQVARSAASTSTAVMRTLQQRGYIERDRPRSRSGPGGAVRHDAAVPREARPRLARRPALRSASSCRAPRWWRRSRRRCALRGPTEPTADRCLSRHGDRLQKVLAARASAAGVTART